MGMKDYINKLKGTDSYEELKQKFEEYKPEIIAGIGTVIIIGGTIFIVKKIFRSRRSSKELSEGIELLEKMLEDTNYRLPSGTKIDWMSPDQIRKVDELIFTDLAPEIEAYVLDNGIERAVSERSYKIGENLNKLVEVKVTQINGD